MRSRLTAFIMVAAGAAMLAATSAVPAQAGGKEAGAFFGGLLLGGALANRGPVYAPPPVYVQPAPVYVQPRCYWQKQRIWDPYIGSYVWRNVQVCG